MKYGYKFTIHGGVLFKKDIIFDLYTTELFKIKQISESGSPLYLISKLLMNGLAGRFGMEFYLPTSVIVSSKISKTLLYKMNVVNNLAIVNNDMVIYTVNQKVDADNPYVKRLVCIAIAASITAEARAHMKLFKNMENLEIYYTDTASLFVNRPLGDEYTATGNELGKMKLVDTYIYIKKLFFLRLKHIELLIWRTKKRL